MKGLEDLIIYKQYLEMIFYTENITEKFSRADKMGLGEKIKLSTYQGMENIINAQKNNFNKTIRLEYLNQIDGILKMLKVLIRVSYKRKCISSKNYEAWSKKITNIANLLGAWIKSCQKQ